MYVPFKAPAGTAANPTTAALAGTSAAVVVPQSPSPPSTVPSGSILGAPLRTPGSMIYRPQFAWGEVPGEEDFRYYFDASNTPALASTVPAGAELANIPLQLQPDAPFVLRAVYMTGIPLIGYFSARLKDADGNYLGDRGLLSFLTYFPGINRATLNPMLVAFEPSIVCRPGSVLFLYLLNISSFPQSLAGTEIVLLGVKGDPRWKD
jgi:hypothetical protein